MNNYHFQYTPLFYTYTALYELRMMSFSRRPVITLAIYSFTASTLRNLIPFTADLIFGNK